MRTNSIYVASCLLLFLWLFPACTPGKKSSDGSSSLPGKGMQYARNITLEETDSCTIVRLLNPWKQGTLLHTYILIDTDRPLPAHLPEGTVVRTPIRNAVINPSMHCSLFEELGAHASIGGICEPEYIKVPSIIADVKAGRIQDCGSGMNPDMEKIIRLRPDAILLSPFENSGGYGKIEKLNVPIIECADYMESSPLGRAEWMRFYGRLCGKAHTADSLFRQIEARYQALVRLGQRDTLRPRVFTELRTGSVWYVSGGHSTTGQLLADAGADYLFAGLEQSGSIPYAPEKVFSQAHTAEYWLFKYNRAHDMTLTDLRREDPLYPRFRAVGLRQVYGCNTSHVPFYEETPFHPDLLLKDLIKIFHPELLPDYTLRYYTRLAENE